MNNLIANAQAPQPDATDVRSAGLLNLLMRIEESIEAETAGLRSDPRFDIKASNVRKSRHLHELSRAFKNIADGDLADDHRDAMLRLREKLDANEAVIRAHLSAVSEVAAMLQNELQGAQTDGTYSVREFGVK
ncbi:hypothetical protein [Chelativorans sp. Marseille-P2723]|uniref:hypothetical protein n=1 Tax=Chelativorans sp. Marseille-P2723 TaxID=2709133 RepID=UPI001FEED748|nr:hypothetical protein [Chelativorans sp. Marseille-P2723]